MIMSKCIISASFHTITLGNTYFRNRIFASPTVFQNLNRRRVISTMVTPRPLITAGKPWAEPPASPVLKALWTASGQRRFGAYLPGLPREPQNLATLAHGIKVYGAVAL